MKNFPKVIIIGLDGASWDKIRHWVKQKKLSFIDKIFKKGVYGILKSTIPSNTCPALPCLYTGKNPGNLGIFDFLKPDGSLVSYKDFEGETLIELLSKMGYRVLFVGARLVYPPPKVNGTIISAVPGLTDVKKLVYPEDKLDVAKEIIPNEEERKYWKSITSNPSKYKKDIMKYLSKRLEKKVRTFNKLLSEEKYDFGFLWIGETDSIQHYCWDDEEILLKFFKKVDRQLENISKKYFKSNLFVISDHGFGSIAKYNFHINEWLLKEGYLNMSGNIIKRSLIRFGYYLMEFYLPDSFAKKILNLLDKFNFKEKRSRGMQNFVLIPLDNLPGIDWNKTLAHLMTNKGWGIKIRKENLDRDYEELREEIIRKLKQLRGPNGNRVIKDAWRGEEIYWGKFKDQIPDIILLKEDSFKVRPSLVGKIFTKIRKKEESYVGDHESARDGIFIAYGPNIKDGGEYIGEIQLYDIAPTILHMYGIPIPEDMDGRVLKEIFREGSDPCVREVRYQKVDTEKELISSKIRELRKLGKIRL